MARSRLELRKMAEAAEAAEAAPAAKGKKKKKKAAKRKTAKRAKRAKDAPQRKRMVWCVFTANMKEEGRFAYDEREKAEEKLAALKTKSPKKMFFIQPVKELILDDGGTAPVAAPPEPDDLDLPEPKPEAAESEEESEDEESEDESEEE